MPCTHAAYLRAAAECRTPCDAVALAADPSLGLSYEALLSICAARLVAATKASIGRHRAKAAAITQRYEGGAHLVAIASELDLPPTMLARVVLEERYSLRKGAKGRHGAGALLRSPSLIDDPRLRSEVAAAVASDAAYGPAVDAARRLTGLQQELVLSQELRARGIPFLSEEQLRERGEAKTPDALLPVPLLVRGRQVRRCRLHRRCPRQSVHAGRWMACLGSLGRLQGHVWRPSIARRVRRDAVRELRQPVRVGAGALLVRLRRGDRRQRRPRAARRLPRRLRADEPLRAAHRAGAGSLAVLPLWCQRLLQGCKTQEVGREPRTKAAQEAHPRPACDTKHNRGKKLM